MKTALKLILTFTVIVTASCPAFAQAYIDLYEAEKYVEALPLLRKAAEAGKANAQYYLGKMYRDGLGGLEQNYTEALGWYQKSVEQNYAEAIDDIGYLYYAGHGVEQSYTEAVEWCSLPVW